METGWLSYLVSHGGTLYDICVGHITVPSNAAAPITGSVLKPGKFYLLSAFYEEDERDKYLLPVVSCPAQQKSSHQTLVLICKLIPIPAPIRGMRYPCVRGAGHETSRVWWRYYSSHNPLNISPVVAYDLRKFPLSAFLVGPVLLSKFLINTGLVRTYCLALIPRLIWIRIRSTWCTRRTSKIVRRRSCMYVNQPWTKIWVPDTRMEWFGIVLLRIILRMEKTGPWRCHQYVSNSRYFQYLIDRWVRHGGANILGLMQASLNTNSLWPNYRFLSTCSYKKEKKKKKTWPKWHPMRLMISWISRMWLAE